MSAAEQKMLLPTTTAVANVANLPNALTVKQVLQSLLSSEIG